MTGSLGERELVRKLVRETRLALSSFEAWVALVDDIQPSLSPHHLAMAVAFFERLQGGTNFHGRNCKLGFVLCQESFATSVF